MEESAWKESRIKKRKQNPKVYQQLSQNQNELGDYLHYIRNQQPNPKIKMTHPQLQKVQSKQIRSPPIKVNTHEVGVYVDRYLKILREVSMLENYATKKIFKKILQFLEEFPSMNFLYEVINSFGKDQKRLSFNESNILFQATDEMIPLFQKIIQKIENLKKQSESKKLLELGHRIEHLQDMIRSSKNQGSIKDAQILKMLKTYEADRVEKYLIMEDNILKAEKRFGNFSSNFIKNREVFSNLNRVYQDIKKHERH